LRTGNAYASPEHNSGKGVDHCLQIAEVWRLVVRTPIRVDQ
jgi:hypothetical protein